MIKYLTLCLLFTGCSQSSNITFKVGDCLEQNNHYDTAYKVLEVGENSLSVKDLKEKNHIIAKYDYPYYSKIDCWNLFPEKSNTLPVTSHKYKVNK